MVNKLNGIYYTPRPLAEYLARPLVYGSNLTVLDPSYGEGALLLAAESVFEKRKNRSNIHLFGCDTKPANGLLKHLPEANLKEIDFFDFPIQNKFQVILMNPPYVRHHIQNTSKIDKYRANFPELCFLSRNSDLWAYFLVKAVSHLNYGGNIGAVLPWAFLQADYAKDLRQWLSENFAEIKAVALSNKYFQTADERIVVLWLRGYGAKCKSIRIGASKTIESGMTFKDVTIQGWNSDRVFYSEPYTMEQILTKCKAEYGFTKFSDHAEVKIGVVTGAVDYFIMPQESAQDAGFRKNRLIPILKNAREFSKYLTGGQKGLDVLVALKANDHLKYRRFIKDGNEKKIHLRAHSRRRKPWYSVIVGKIPDAFFHYRVTKTPYLIPNKHKVQCTNSIHRVYFKDANVTEMKWISVSMLSSLSQLSVEANSKTYGRSVLKIEPKSLKNALVIKRNNSKVNAVYNQIMRLLANSKKELARDLATEFICTELGIPNDFKCSAEDVLLKLQNLR